jgi:hypothetical protein
VRRAAERLDASGVRPRREPAELGPPRPPGPLVPHELFPTGVPVLSVEAGVTFGWERFADESIGIDRFGASAPGDEVLRRLGIDVDHVVERATDHSSTGAPHEPSHPSVRLRVRAEPVARQPAAQLPHVGELAEFRDRGVRGLTSNPTIFQKAISGSDDYDEQFAGLVRDSGVDVRRHYWDLVLADIHGACDVFDPTYEDTDGLDGYVSVEVDPGLAHDGAGTEQAARELHERDRPPNLMVKIPATRPGLPAIRR